MATLKETLNKCGVYTYPLDVPIDAGARESLEIAKWAIHRQIENDDWQCDQDDCTEENPQCSWMELQVAYKRICSILDPIHRSLNPDRLSHYPEEIFLRRWQKENERIGHLNHGYGTLELLLTPTRVRCDKQWSFTSAPYFVPPVSQRDAEVAATVIQWLGTNCGRGFISGAEREINEARKEHDAFENEKNKNVFQKDRILPTHENLARQAAIYGMSSDNPKFEPLVKAIVAAIQSAVKPFIDSIAGDGI